MPVILPPEDFDFLARVRELGTSGLTQSQIAEELGLTLASLRFRLGRLGFEFMPVNDLRTTLTKTTWSELDVQAAGPEPVAA